MRTRNSIRAFVRPSVRPSVRRSVGPLVREHESKSVKTRISAPAHASATGIGRLSGLVFKLFAGGIPDRLAVQPNHSGTCCVGKTCWRVVGLTGGSLLLGGVGQGQWAKLISFQVLMEMVVNKARYWSIKIYQDIPSFMTF